MAAGRTSWQLTRLLMVLCWLLWIVTFFITVTLFQAVLQIRVVGQVVQNMEKGFIWYNTDLVRATPLSVINRDRLDEMFIRYYVELRYSLIPDRAEMEYRWGKSGIMGYLSSASAYKEFLPSTDIFDKIGNMTPRVVDILNMEKQGTYYTVDFDVYTFDGSSKWVKNAKRAVIQFAFAPARVLLASSIANPFGFVVVRVDESERKSVTQ